jgi:hypothetical protein
MTIYFKSMSDSDYEGRCFKIERLSTPSSVNHGNQTWGTKWLWYWKNPEGRWRKYGHSVIHIEHGAINSFITVFL